MLLESVIMHINMHIDTHNRRWGIESRNIVDWSRNHAFNIRNSTRYFVSGNGNNNNKNNNNNDYNNSNKTWFLILLLRQFELSTIFLDFYYLYQITIKAQYL